MNKKPHLMKTIGVWTWNSSLVLSKVNRRSVNDCWEWMGAQSPSAPLFGAKKNNRPQMTQAARILFREYYNQDCEDKEITHSCGNKNCMNFDHWEIKDIKVHGAPPTNVRQGRLKPVSKSRGNRWWTE
jgi:hypothetical protein